MIIIIVHKNLNSNIRLEKGKEDCFMIILLVHTCN